MPEYQVITGDSPISTVIPQLGTNDEILRSNFHDVVSPDNPVNGQLWIKNEGTFIRHRDKWVAINELIVDFDGTTRQKINSVADGVYDSDAPNMKQLREVKQSVSDGKLKIAEAITDKGVDTSATDEFAKMAENITNIKGGAGEGVDVLSPAIWGHRYLKKTQEQPYIIDPNLQEVINDGDLFFFRPDNRYVISRNKGYIVNMFINSSPQSGNAFSTTYSTYAKSQNQHHYNDFFKEIDYVVDGVGYLNFALNKDRNKLVSFKLYTWSFVTCLELAKNQKIKKIFCPTQAQPDPNGLRYVFLLIQDTTTHWTRLEVYSYKLTGTDGNIAEFTKADTAFPVGEPSNGVNTGEEGRLFNHLYMGISNGDHLPVDMDSIPQNCVPSKYQNTNRYIAFSVLVGMSQSNWESGSYMYMLRHFIIDTTTNITVEARSQYVWFTNPYLSESEQEAKPIHVRDIILNGDFFCSYQMKTLVGSDISRKVHTVVMNNDLLLCYTFNWDVEYDRRVYCYIVPSLKHTNRVKEKFYPLSHYDYKYEYLQNPNSNHSTFVHKDGEGGISFLSFEYREDYTGNYPLTHIRADESTKILFKDLPNVLPLLPSFTSSALKFLSADSLSTYQYTLFNLSNFTDNKLTLLDKYIIPEPETQPLYYTLKNEDSEIYYNLNNIYSPTYNLLVPYSVNSITNYWYDPSHEFYIQNIHDPLLIAQFGLSLPVGNPDYSWTSANGHSLGFKADQQSLSFPLNLFISQNESYPTRDPLIVDLITLSLKLGVVVKEISWMMGGMEVDCLEQFPQVTPAVIETVDKLQVSLLVVDSTTNLIQAKYPLSKNIADLKQTATKQYIDCLGMDYSVSNNFSSELIALQNENKNLIFYVEIKLEDTLTNVQYSAYGVSAGIFIMDFNYSVLKIYNKK